MRSIYIVLREHEVTNELINLSTSKNINEATRLPNGRVVLEFDESKSDRILSYRWYSRDEIMKLMNESSSWLDWFFGLFN